MISKSFPCMALGIAYGFAAGAVSAEPVTYNIDPSHTFPAFEADHQGGLSIWRGKIERTSGTIVLDREAKAGSVEVSMDMSSIDFGLEAMNEHAKASDILDVARFPTATYVGALTDFRRNGEPTAAEGNLTLHGVTRPLRLEINQFHCQPNQAGIETCGADVSATFNRDDFGVDFGKAVGFFMYVNLLITVEAQRADPSS